MGSTSDPMLECDDADETFDIDFIMAFNNEDQDPSKIKKRQVYESNLRREGLQLKYDTEQQVHFVKIRASKEVLSRYAEILKFKLPLKHLPEQELYNERNSKLKECCLRCLSKGSDTSVEPKIFYEFSRQCAQLFDVDYAIFCNAGMRNGIVYAIMWRQYFVNVGRSPLNMGIEKLLEDGVYLSAYPLHNDDMRKLLRIKWASLRRCLNIQPLLAVYQYFGAKVALYFSWLGFYIIMLVPLSIFGFLYLFYGLTTMGTDPVSHDICHPNKTILMCPQCDEICDYWELKSICPYSKVHYLLDNELTVAFALVMSVWSILYLEFWKQYLAGLVHSWGLTDFSHQIEHPRPQYLSKLHAKGRLSMEFNVGNSFREPVVPFWRLKFLPIFASYSILVLFICISLIATFGLTVYRMAHLVTYYAFGSLDFNLFKILVLPTITGILNLIVISLLNLVYTRLAKALTNLEYHRTDTEYEQSLTIKYYIFQFVNYYSSLFYIAFIKNQFIGYPGKYTRLWGFRQEECHSGGCLMELCLQLVIIMVGKQAINAVIELLLPYISNLLRKKKSKVKVKSSNPWTRDYNLEQFTSDSFFEEYLIVVVQFGFIVLFGIAFPLAPFLALINNIFELRLDAIKFLKLLQRPRTRRERNIGVWYNIMQMLTNISVFVNALIITLRTHLVPKLIYIIETGDTNLNGFLDFELARFDTKDFESASKVKNSRYGNVEQCYYFDYRNPPDHKHPYRRPVHYWYIWIGRLAFIVVFQNVIGILQSFVTWAVPDVPPKLLRRIKREEHMAREHIMKSERLRRNEIILL